MSNKQELRTMSLKQQFTNTSNDLMGSIESRLSGILKPVKPNPVFVNNLRDRFQVVSHPAMIKRFNNLQFITILVAGILSVVVLITMGIRFLLNILMPGKNSTSTS
jgi:hypothetical protein